MLEHSYTGKKKGETPMKPKTVYKEGWQELPKVKPHHLDCPLVTGYKIGHKLSGLSGLSGLTFR